MLAHVDQRIGLTPPVQTDEAADDIHPSPVLGVPDEHRRFCRAPRVGILEFLRHHVTPASAGVCALMLSACTSAGIIAATAS